MPKAFPGTPKSQSSPKLQIRRKPLCLRCFEDIQVSHSGAMSAPKSTKNNKWIWESVLKAVWQGGENLRWMPSPRCLLPDSKKHSLVSRAGVIFLKCFSTISKNNYWKVAALMVSGKEAYGSQKHALNISLTLETMNIEDFQSSCHHFFNWLMLFSMRQ